jgi:uncharacterized protein YciI
MKRLYSRFIVLMITLLLFGTSVAAQEKPEFDMGKMQMVFLTLDPGWNHKTARAIAKVTREQRDYVNDMIVSGKCALAGLTTGVGPIKEILVFKNESTEEVKALTETLPSVKGRMMKAEVLPWYAARNYIATPESPLKPTDYIFGLLVRGPKWTPEKTAETNKIQEGHMANINRLAETGKLILAGPFFIEGERRGVFIFKVNTLKEAQALTDTDPAVIAGRLKIELYHWTVPKGILK